jgi:hypothetical protein
MPDEVLTELWRIKDDIARQYGNDVEALVAHLRELESLERLPVVQPSSVRPSAEQGATGGAPKAARA